MAELAAPASSRPRRDIPIKVTIAFWLWWPLIVVQAGWVVWSFGSSLASGVDSVSDGFFWSGQIGNLVLLAVAVAECLLVFRLRRGSRAARGWLVGFALATGSVAGFLMLTMIVLTRSYGSSVVAPASIPYLVIGVVVVLAFAGAILPFLSPADRYFPKTKPPAPLPYPGGPYGPAAGAHPGGPSPAPPVGE
jgi:hypothetical protein